MPERDARQELVDAVANADLLGVGWIKLTRLAPGRYDMESIDTALVVQLHPAGKDVRDDVV